MYHKKSTVFLAGAGIVFAVGGPAVRANGFDLPDHDAFAVARGMAFAATADNPSAVYYNPAGITQLPGHNFRGGIYGLHLTTSYQSPAGDSFDTDKPWHAVPQLFYTYGSKKLPLAFGLGLYSPFGLSLRWPQNTGFRTVATEGSLTYLTFNPVVAWQVAPTFSLAAGLTINRAEVDLRQGLVWPTQGNDEFRFKGDGWDFGYNLGAHWKPNPKIAIGATFRSTTTVDLEGRTRFQNSTPFGPVPAFPQQTVAAQGDLPFPLKMICGISYRPTPAWNLEFNADYTGWSRLGTLQINQASGFPPLLPQNIPLTLNWDSSWYYEFGGTHYFDNGWHVSAGYILNENSIPDANYLPTIADLDRHILSTGIGFKGERFDFDVAYQFGYGPSRTVSGSALTATGQSADGEYEFLSHALMISVGWHF